MSVILELQVRKDARALAKKLGHAAVIASKGDRCYGNLAAFDSWAPLDRGWRVVEFVSSKGPIMAHAEGDTP
jgi:hypothetical protein